MSTGMPHGPVTRHGTGPWDYVTRGFWDGGRRIMAGELRPGDVYREGTLSGWPVGSVRLDPSDYAGYGPRVFVTMADDGTSRVYRPDSPLELLERV